MSERKEISTIADLKKYINENNISDDSSVQVLFNDGFGHLKNPSISYHEEGKTLMIGDF